MCYEINQAECTSCGYCPLACIEDAIEEVDDKYYINCNKCTDCGLCAKNCPADAIHKK